MLQIILAEKCHKATWTLLVQVMPCCLMAYRQSDTHKRSSVTLESQYKCLRNGGHIVRASIRKHFSCHVFKTCINNQCRILHRNDSLVATRPWVSTHGIFYQLHKCGRISTNCKRRLISYRRNCQVPLSEVSKSWLIHVKYLCHQAVMGHKCRTISERL